MRKYNFVLLVVVFSVAQAFGSPRGGQQPAGAGQTVRPIGVVTAVQSDQLTLHTDAGPVLTVDLPADVKVMRVPPGAKSLKVATTISVGDIATGDRVLVLGKVSSDQKSMKATRVIDMSKASLAVAHEAQEQAWERRGISGVVKSVDPAAKSLVLSVQNATPTPGNMDHSVTLTLGANAKLLRYAPDSVRFSDARPGPFDAIRPGDQLRALGDKSANGSTFTAEEVVSGTFRNIPATVISVDAPKGTITVKDLATKQPVVVHTNSESKLHTLPMMIAYMIARFNSGGAAGPGGQGHGAPGAQGNKAAPAGRSRGEGGSGGGGMYGRPGGRAGGFGPMGAHMPSFSQMLEHTPPLSLASLKPGDPLIVVSTEGAKPGEVTAIAVLSGVAPILEARPKGSQDVSLGPWNMSSGGGGGGEGEGMSGGGGQGMGGAGGMR